MHAYEVQKQGRSDRTRVPICICDAHGDALHYWSSTHAGRPRSVLHLDSHADMMTNWSNQIWTSVGPNWKPPSKEALVGRVAQEVDLANFQPSAIFQGFVDSIVWLRSDFPLGQYNGPPPGHYRRSLAMPDYSAPGKHADPIIGDGARPLLAFFPISGGSFHEYGPRLIHQARREILQAAPVSIPPERNTLWDDSWDCTRPPVKHLSVEFDHSVVTLDQLLAPGSSVLQEVQERLRLSGPEASEWILDIDLDYFATYSPLLAFLLRKHGWILQSEAEAFAQWAVPLGQMCSQGLEPATRHTLFAPVCQPFTVREIVHLPFTEAGQHAYPTADSILSAFHQIHPACEVSVELLRGLSSLVCQLTAQQRLQWATLHADDWWWVMQGQGPHHYSTPSEIRRQVQKLRLLFSAFRRPPSLVTIARSMDMYMPEGASDIAEWEVLLLIHHVWGRGTTAHLPGSLEECTLEDAQELLQNVTFFPTSRPLPGQKPGPLLPRPWPVAALSLPDHPVWCVQPTPNVVQPELSGDVASPFNAVATLCCSSLYFEAVD